MIGTVLSVLGQMAAAELLSQGATYACSSVYAPAVKPRSNPFIDYVKWFIKSVLVALGLKREGVEIDFVDCILFFLIAALTVYAVYWVFSKIFGSRKKRKRK